MGGTMSERIVVGIDGSETAKLAARWAASEAKLRDADLMFVCAWEVPAQTFGFGYTAIPEALVGDLAKGAEATLADALEKVRSESPEVSVETAAVEGQPARVLLDASEDAGLLVVGSRGLGGFRDLLLGSVSQQCAHYAKCPVVIVRHMKEGD
jgi:nucleotide-binding universal stress UspA family protein